MSSFVASAEEGDQVAATVSNAGGLSEVDTGSTIVALAPGNHTSGVRDFFDA
jgi:predicted transcriptional regulator